MVFDAAPSVLRSVIKTIPVAALALIAAGQGSEPLAVALTLSAVGDLSLSRQGERAFLAGLVAFAAAHLAYIWLFNTLASDWPPPWPAALLVGYALSTEAWLTPFTRTLRGPVRFYVLLITGMGLAAFAAPPLVLLGALIFMASDTLLAVQLFRLPADSGHQRVISMLLWALY